MVELYPLFLNLVLGVIIISIFFFYRGRVEELKKARAETEAILEIRTRARTRELEELAAKLERQVSERTKELQERINELERFQKLTVGRELKMIELKEEMKKLKEKLEEFEEKHGE